VLAAVAVAGIAGCAYDHTAALTRLRENNPRVQTATMYEVEAAGDQSMIPELINLLESEDEGVRFMAAATLHRLTGQHFGFQFARENERGEIIAKWRTWWETHPAAAPSPTPAAPSPATTPGDKS